VQFAVHRPAFFNHDRIGSNLSVGMAKKVDKVSGVSLVFGVFVCRSEDLRRSHRVWQNIPVTGLRKLLFFKHSRAIAGNSVLDMRCPRLGFFWDERGKNDADANRL